MKKINLIFVSFSIFLLMLMGVRFQQAYAVSVKVTDEFLEEQATDIIKGKVVSLESKWTAEGIVTNVGIKVDKSIKGKHGNRITLEVLGGVVGEIGLFVSESPQFSMGEEVKLFLKQKKPGIYKVTGGRQGKKRISSGTAPISIVPQSTNRYRRYFVYLDWDYMVSPMGEHILINEELAGAEDRIKAAANEWNDRGAANFQFTFGELTLISSISRDVPDGCNVVCMEQLDDLGENVLAVAYYWFDPTTGYIIEADCGIDVNWDWYLGEQPSDIRYYEYDLQGIITHEFGHFLSLVDVYENYEDSESGFPVTMYGYASPGYNETNTGKRTLEPADTNGIQLIYGERTDVHDVAVTNIEAPPWVLQDDPVSLDVTVVNQGTYGESFTVTLTDTTDAEDIGSEVVSLDAGDSTTLSFSWYTTDVSLGDHTLRAEASTVPDETDTADNSKTTMVTVKEPAHDVAVTTIDAPLEVVTGDIVAVDVTVENQGTYSEITTVALTDTTDGVTIGSEKTSLLNAGDSTVVSFHWDTTGASIDDHILKAEASVVAGETDTADNSTTTTVAIKEESAATMHVASIVMKFKIAGINTSALATVTIYDASDNPVVGATVSGYWKDATSDADSGITDVNGAVTVGSDRVKRAVSGTEFTFTVDNVIKEEWTWDEEPSSGSISVP